MHGLLASLVSIALAQGAGSGLTLNSLLRTPSSPALGIAVAASSETVAALSDGGNHKKLHLFARRGAGWYEEATFQVGHGVALDVDGTTVAKGSPYQNFPTFGWVDVFSRHASGWRKEAILTPGYAGQDFGNAVALDGDRLLVGARLDSSAAAYKNGSAYVFERVGGNWKETAKLTGPQQNTSQFGYAVALDGTTAVVATVRDVVHVYELRGKLWRRTGRLVPSAPQTQFGRTLAVSGSTILVGAPSEGANREGAVYVFVRARGGWREHQKVSSPSTGVRNDQFFGQLVSISGGTALVSSGYHAFGTVHLLERQGGTWSEVDEYWNYQHPYNVYNTGLVVQYSGPNWISRPFGRSIDLEGDLAVVGELGPTWSEEGVVHVLDVDP